MKVISTLGLLFLSVSVAANQVCLSDSMAETTPSTQFTVHGDGTVTDSKTGLMWMQCQEGLSDADCATGLASQYDWSQALQRASDLNTQGGFAGFSDWRVPNIAELLTLVEEQCTQPAINVLVFPNTDDSKFFWTASPNLNNTDASWYVDFKFGISGPVTRDGRYPVRLVRSIIE